MSQRLEHATSRASEGHDDHLVSLALATQGVIRSRGRVWPWGRLPVPALN
jgi:hypothetical protein